MKYTENYQLPQWDKQDRIMMEDFNRITQTLDAAVGEGSRTLAEHGALLLRCGNCQLYTTTYRNSSADRVLTFPGKPLLVAIHSSYKGDVTLLVYGAASSHGGNGSAATKLVWSGNTLTIPAESNFAGGLNYYNYGSTITYSVVALLQKE